MANTSSPKPELPMVFQAHRAEILENPLQVSLMKFRCVWQVKGKLGLTQVLRSRCGEDVIVLTVGEMVYYLFIINYEIRNMCFNQFPHNLPLIFKESYKIVDFFVLSVSTVNYFFYCWWIDNFRAVLFLEVRKKIRKHVIGQSLHITSTADVNKFVLYKSC